jgi:hypothetical protein
VNRKLSEITDSIARTTAGRRENKAEKENNEEGE